MFIDDFLKKIKNLVVQIYKKCMKCEYARTIIFLLTNLSVYAIIKIQRNIPTMSVEKNKRSHRVVVRGTLCVFDIVYDA